jgi:hypothetical protein
VAIIVICLGVSRVGVKLANFEWERNRLLWEVAEETDPKSLVVTDLTLHQVFWDKNAVVWERLPAVSVDDPERFWPQNRDRLIDIVVSADLFVLQAKGVETIASLGVRALECQQSADFYVCK